MEEKKEYKSGNIWEQNFSGNTAIILGSEGNGISEKVLEKCDFIIPIPMENDVESLNVSVAGAVVMYEWKRQQFFKINKNNKKLVTPLVLLFFYINSFFFFLKKKIKLLK
ncbi:protein containing tRNA/rRNA methyltransferase, SpoU domain [sediment metagenome]|uniref:Protein containing tRNA/rRNA methyltransferase, SpoU domain n=1 Tax=sediment metagenome TaxID=749907 RepID=D9PM90_9ZZZZ